MAALRNILARQWQGWLSRRIPRQREVVLNQRRIFIFPTRTGAWFLAVLSVMLLAAINYQNNLAFALVFWLLALLVISILHTYMNLSGLHLKALRAHPVFAGDSARFDLQLSCRGRRPRRSLELDWPGGSSVEVAALNARCELRLFYPAGRRGRLRPPRLRLQSRYPLGMIRAWTWVELDWETWVYPRPLPGPLPTAQQAAAQGRELRIHSAGEEFHSFRTYRPGDSLNRVLWKSYARGGELQTLQLAEPVAEHLWLDYASFGGDRETRLSHLCYWVLTLSRGEQAFGLRLPGRELAPAAGPAQRERALDLLARFEGVAA